MSCSFSWAPTNLTYKGLVRWALLFGYITLFVSLHDLDPKGWNLDPCGSEFDMHSYNILELTLDYHWIINVHW